MCMQGHMNVPTVVNAARHEVLRAAAASWSIYRADGGLLVCQLGGRSLSVREERPRKAHLYVEVEPTRERQQWHPDEPSHHHTTTS